MKTVLIWLVPLQLLVAGGCVSARSKELRLIADVPDLSALKASWDALPKRTTYIATTSGDWPEVDVALHEIGEASWNRLFVLIHGVNSNHRTWQFVVGALGAGHNLLLVDLPGCGDSCCPRPEDLGRNGYSPHALADRVLQAIDSYLAPREPKPRITLVGHSLGGTIATRMMGSSDLRARYDRVLRQVDTMILLAPGDVEIVNPSPELMQLAVLSGLEFTLADLLGILQQKVDEATLDAVVNPDRALREDADKTGAILRHRDTRLALQAMLLQAVPRQPDGRLDWPAIERLVADYDNVEVPCLIVWGEYDETLPVSMGYKLAAQIPTARLYVVENCMHSVHLEYPVLCADLMLRFTASGYAGVESPAVDRPISIRGDGEQRSPRGRLRSIEHGGAS